MAILKLNSLDEIDRRVWSKYGLRKVDGIVIYKVMNYEFTKDDVLSIVDFGNEYEIITAKATVLIGKKFFKYEVKYNVADAESRNNRID